jgi:predicted transport protein
MTTATPEDFFEGSDRGLVLYRAVVQAMQSFDADVDLRVSRSQIAFHRRRGFAYVWVPGRYVKSAVPLVLSIAVDRPLNSERFKEVVHPSPTVWMHHLELHETADIDGEVIGWLQTAYESAT